MVIEIVGIGGILHWSETDSNEKGETYKVGGKVIVSVVQPVVNERRKDALACQTHLPHTSDVHHVFWIVLVDYVPLLRE